MPIRSLRTKLTLWYTGLLALTFLVLGVAAYLIVAYTLHQEADSALRSVAEALAEKSRGESNALVPPEVDEIFRHFFGPFQNRPYFEWLNPRRDAWNDARDGRGFPFTPEAKENARRGVATFETMTGAGQYPVRILTWPVIEAGRLTAVVRVGMSRMGIDKAKQRFLTIMALLFPFALVLAGGGGWFFAHRALSPVDRMTGTARHISAERLHERLELTGANDELDRLADTINGMLGRLDGAFAEIRQFTADASHELQTPLTILRGEIEVALRSKRKPEEYIEVMKSALAEIERISLLVEGLLLLARADAGVLKMDRKPVDLYLLARSVADQADTLARSKGVHLRIGETAPIEVSGDPAHLRRLLLNLVDNAIKYTPSGGQVKVSVVAADPWAILSVEDTGPGIPEDEKPQIFKRFYRSAGARSLGLGGSGLGLSIVKSIAEAHDGKVELDSSPGKGSTFKVYLPLKPDNKD